MAKCGLVTKLLSYCLVVIIVCCVCVLDGDGRSELVVGYTDRVVRAFRWEEPSDATDLTAGQLVLLKKWLLDGQVHTFTHSCSLGETI